MAGGLGFEPRLAESESAVLPLDDPPREERKLNSESRLYKARNAISIVLPAVFRDAPAVKRRSALRTIESGSAIAEKFLSTHA